MRAFWASVCDCVCETSKQMYEYNSEEALGTRCQKLQQIGSACRNVVSFCMQWPPATFVPNCRGEKTSWCHLIVSSCFACMWGSVPDTPLISLFISSLCECASVCVWPNSNDTCSAKGNGEANKYLPPTSHLKIFKSTAGIQLAKENLQFGLIAPIREVKAEAYLARTLALFQHEAKLTYWISNVATFLTHRGTQHTELSFLADDKALQEYQEGTDCFCAEQPAWSKFLARGISYYSISLHKYIYIYT